MATITPELATQITTAIEAIPAPHFHQPCHDIIVPSPELAFQHLQDWAFTQGYAFVVESRHDIKIRWDCMFHKKETRNSRKTAEEDRQRVQTFIRGTGCPVYFYVSRKKTKGNQWVFCHGKYPDHNHSPALDPFSLHPHRHRRPGYLQAILVAETHRGVVGFKTSSNILHRMGLEIDRREFYNLHRKRGETRLTAQEEAQLILNYLNDESCHVEVDEVYIRDNLGNKTDRVIQSIVWFTPEQLRLCRRFVSSFLLETDATFNKESRRLLLHNLVGIDNCGKTFPAMQIFAINEGARVFEHVEGVWERYMFYDCPGPAVLAGDFALGLAAAVARSAVKKKEAIRKAQLVSAAKGKGKEIDIGDGVDEIDGGEVLTPQAPHLKPYKPDLQTIIVDCVADVAEDSIKLSNGFIIILQRCEKHAVDAIKKRLVRKGYSKKSKDEALNLIWQWVKSPDLSSLDDNRQTLLDHLRPLERIYLTNYYEPKEHSFCRAYTSKYPNLGVHSTQRNEKQHHVGGVRLSKNIPTSQAVEIITQDLLRLPKQYDDMVNKSRNSDPRLIDKSFFQSCLRRLTHYCLEKSMEEYVAAKSMLDQLEREHRILDFNVNIGCQEDCPLPLRFGIPCRCWMAYFYNDELPLPLNLFHPRWLIDGPPVVNKKWEMRIDNPNYDLSGSASLQDRYTGDRFTDRGEQIILDAAADLAGLHKQLPPEDAPKFAEAVQLIAQRLKLKQLDKSTAKEALPLRLPSPQPVPKGLSFVPGRKRALTGAESAQRQAADESRARRKAEKQAKAKDMADDVMEALEEGRSQFYDEVAAEYSQTQYQQLSFRPTDSDDSDNTNDFPDIDDFQLAAGPSRILGRKVPEGKAHKLWKELDPKLKETTIPISSPLNDTPPASEATLSQIRTPIYISSSDDDSDSSTASSNLTDLPTIETLLSQRPISTAPSVPSSSRPQRARKPTTKQASQYRREEEKKRKKEAKDRKKSHNKDVTQLVDSQMIELPFRSSQ